jgi:Ni/Co efflux regulator RcnB
MKLQRICTLLAALTMAIPAVSMADDHHDGDRDHDRAEHAYWGDHDRDHRGERPDWDHPGYRHDDYRGVGPGHEWRRGSRLPDEYRGHRHEVRDWRDRHLSEPPRGYHWVEVNGDYVLAAIATGVILDTLLTQ